MTVGGGGGGDGNSVTKQQFVETQTIRQTDISASLDIWVTNTLSFRMTCPQIKLLLVLISSKHNIPNCWSVNGGSGFCCLLQNCISRGYDKFLFHQLIDIVVAVDLFLMCCCCCRVERIYKVVVVYS